MRKMSKRTQLLHRESESTKAMSAATRTGGAAEVETALAYLIGQIAEIRQQMKADDAEIAEIRAETAALKMEGAALKMESAALRMKTRTIVAGLREIAWLRAGPVQQNSL